MKKPNLKTVTVALGVIAVILVAAITGSFVHYSSLLEQKDSKLSSQNVTVNQLSNTISQLGVSIANLTDQLDKRNSEVSSLTNQTKTQQNQILNLTNQRNDLQTWLEGNVSALNSTINGLQAQILNLNNQLSSMDTQVSSLRIQLADANSQISTYKSQIDQLNSNVTQLQNLLNTTKNQLDAANNLITELSGTIANDKATIEYYKNLNSALSNQLSTATTNASNLQTKVNQLRVIIDLEINKLQTLVFHVCEKDWITIPNATSTYNQLLSLNNGSFNILLLPEYHEHNNLTAELSWLNRSFGGPQGIPIMLDVFGSESKNATPTPKLSTSNISAAMAVSNVRYLRIYEAVSWHMEFNLPFPTDYVLEILSFAKSRGLKVFWTEHKPEAFALIQNITQGYNDTVTVSFSTNSEFLKPGSGCLQANWVFQHWGASVQSWYWSSYTNGSERDMPESLLVQHALSAKNIGAEIIEFEPCWYFFENGQPNATLKLLITMLK